MTLSKATKGLLIAASKNPCAETSAALSAALDAERRHKDAERQRRIDAGIDPKWVRHNSGALVTKNVPGKPRVHDFPQPKGAANTVGQHTAARYDFLEAGARVHDSPGGGVGVNRKWCRPLHPHGQRLVEEGLMTIHRQGTRSCAHTHLRITKKGLAELTRMRKRLRISIPA